MNFTKNVSTKKINMKNIMKKEYNIFIGERSESSMLIKFLLTMIGKKTFMIIL